MARSEDGAPGARTQNPRINSRDRPRLKPSGPVSEQIRAGMGEIRACRTPAERVEVEARVKPLVIQRDGLAIWRPGIY